MAEKSSSTELSPIRSIRRTRDLAQSRVRIQRSRLRRDRSRAQAALMRTATSPLALGGAFTLGFLANGRTPRSEKADKKPRNWRGILANVLVFFRVIQSARRVLE